MTNQTRFRWPQSGPAGMLDPVPMGAPAEWRVRLYFADYEQKVPTKPGQPRVSYKSMKFDNEMEARMHCAVHGGEYTIIDV